MWVADLAMNVPNHLHCLNKRLCTPFPQSNIAAAELFTEFYNWFIADEFCERPRCDFLSYTLFPLLDIDKYLGCPWSELLGERSDFSKLTENFFEQIAAILPTSLNKFFLCGSWCIATKLSLNSASIGPIDNVPELVQIMVGAEQSTSHYRMSI